MTQLISFETPKLVNNFLQQAESSSLNCYQKYAFFIQQNGDALANLVGHYSGKLIRGILCPLSICNLGKKVQIGSADGFTYLTKSTIYLFANALRDIHWIAAGTGIATGAVYLSNGAFLIPSITAITTLIYLTCLAYKKFTTQITKPIDYPKGILKEAKTGITISPISPTPSPVSSLEKKTIVHYPGTFPISCLISGGILNALANDDFASAIIAIALISHGLLSLLDYYSYIGGKPPSFFMRCISYSPLLAQWGYFSYKHNPIQPLYILGSIVAGGILTSLGSKIISQIPPFSKLKQQ